MHLDPSLAKKSTHRKGRRKINIEFISDKSRRLITFSKRKAGIMKKAYELATLTGTQVLLLVASETGHVYTFATPKLQPLITKPEGKSFIQSCLNTPDEDNQQEFEMRPKADGGMPDFDNDYMPPASYTPSSPPHHQQYYAPPPHYPPNGNEPPRHGYDSPGSHYQSNPPREQYDYAEYPGEFRADYPGDYQVHPSGPAYQGRRMSYPEPPRSGNYPPPHPHQHGGYSHGLPPPLPGPHGHPDHPPHHGGPVHSSYHPGEYARDYPPPPPMSHPPTDYRSYPMSHPPYPDPKYHDYGGRPEFDRSEPIQPHMQTGYDGPPMGQGPMDMGHQNGYMHLDHGHAHGPHDHIMPKEEHFGGQ